MLGPGGLEAMMERKWSAEDVGAMGAAGGDGRRGEFILAGGGRLGANSDDTGSAQSRPHSKKVDPQINAPFQKGSVKNFIKRFETNDREVFVKRREIAEVLDLKPGMAVADIGAGTGLFTRLFADTVGPGGKVLTLPDCRY